MRVFVLSRSVRQLQFFQSLLLFVGVAMRCRDGGEGDFGEKLDLMFARDNASEIVNERQTRAKLWDRYEQRECRGKKGSCVKRLIEKTEYRGCSSASRFLQHWEEFRRNGP